MFGCRLASSLDSAHKEFKTQQGEDEPLRRGVEVNQIIFTNSAPKRSVFSRDPSYEERLKVELFSVCIKKSRPHYNTACVKIICRTTGLEMYLLKHTPEAIWIMLPAACECLHSSATQGIWGMTTSGLKSCTAKSHQPIWNVIMDITSHQWDH